MIPPHPELQVCVVIPARDEEETIEACLAALRHQEGVGAHAVEVLLVLDSCSDDTERRARAAAERAPALTLRVLPGPGEGAGAARALGMDLAAERLHTVGRPEGLIASTDADSRVSPGWIANQLAAMAAGAEAIGGDIVLDEASQAKLSPATVERRTRGLAARRAALTGAGSDDADHPHFSGASLGVSARVYRAVGGMEPLRSLEDEGFAARLALAGVRLHRPSAVRVTTSARTGGRAGRGLSTDLAIGEWLATRTWNAGDFTIGGLSAAKRRSASVVVLASDGASAIGPTVQSIAPLTEAGLIDELLLVDAGSAGDTAEVAGRAGAEPPERAWAEVAEREEAEVLLASEVMRDLGPCLGRGDAMWRAASVATGQILVFIDADAEGFAAAAVIGLLGAMQGELDLRMVKGAAVRPPIAGDSNVTDRAGGLSELVARPVLNLSFPCLVGIAQPLAVETAIDRDLFSRFSVPVGGGVELAMLIDAWRTCGLDGLGQVNLGEWPLPRRHAEGLGAIAMEVMIAADQRAHADRPGDEAHPRGHSNGSVADPVPSALVAAAADSTTRLLPIRYEERPPLGSRATTTAPVSSRTGEG